jgi:hypothetical protein
MLALSAALFLPGCHGTHSQKAVTTEPALAPMADADGTTIATPPPTTKTVTFVDRHPMLYKPRDYWDGAGDNKVVKATAATVVGIPAGIVGELKQIVVGRPTDAKY